MRKVSALKHCVYLRFQVKVKRNPPFVIVQLLYIVGLCSVCISLHTPLIFGGTALASVLGLKVTVGADSVAITLSLLHKIRVNPLVLYAKFGCQRLT